MSVAGVTLVLLDGGQAAEHEDDLLALRAEVYGPDGDGPEAARRSRVWRRQPGFVLAEARHGGYLVGYASGMSLRTSTSWWRELTTPLPDELVTEHPGRTFAVTDLAVRAAWRRQGIGRSLHDLLLSGRPEERATLTVAPGSSPAQAAFRAWGWTKLGRTRGPDPGTPVLDVLVIALPRARELDWHMSIAELGHTGLWVTDLDLMRDFYERVLGLTVTDADDEQGIVFFSSRPGTEHHEFVLQRGRTAPVGAMLSHQISWRVDSVETLQMYHHRFKAEGVPVQQEVTHGNAYGIYFFDPEGNRGEVYMRIPRDVRQPFRKSLNLEQSVEDVNAEAERLLADDGPRYQPVTWQPVTDSPARYRA
jgi:catechol 2,3-dioxygenase-like lactoylglutathione lyase family enzyme/ribosomal protein S18 acetylase RimI-like enzyme